MDSRTGESITADQLRNGVFIWEIKNPLYFETLEHYPIRRGSTMMVTRMRIKFNHGLRKALQMHKCYLNLTIYHYLRTTSGMILSIFRRQLFRYLNNLGVLSISNILSGCSHVFYNVFPHVEDVNLSYDIKYKLY
ncbi:replication enhancer protein [Velvet bean golden mosaic virus]|uniref:Replication enhancer n=1 Tax=Velvet bean golden mosaic virus TaxID=1881630 RepID=A0A1B1UUG4_9GEMI|nr:replication enhancer protein [Velvet bean golden mosaic virus]ANW06444.1 replication enhancer protein [Velvet bean golden mosaic virus]ANW06449.1 replication enhancer protein [Velvet bean golden mosaic virus]ANW06456.1 replication enhancer protein [Velvet bean golden mosaic virus]ANW06462.1 replication enhancer protein [Velvet bean golden mosaic virus]ANW06468.1 replication enhancer protein [Velvet bean golden mosaic virus]